MVAGLRVSAMWLSGSSEVSGGAPTELGQRDYFPGLADWS